MCLAIVTWVIVLEFWPEYVGGPLWEDGRSVPLDDLPVTGELRRRLAEWSAEYADDRLPFGAEPDLAWIRQGQELLVALRAELGATHRIVTEEDWWEPGYPLGMSKFG